MNVDLLALIGRLEAFEDYATEHHIPPTYRKAAKEAIVRLVAMDAQILKLQAIEGEREWTNRLDR